MKSWWQYFPKAFSSDECKWLIEFAKAKEPAAATIADGGKFEVDHNFRRSTLRWLRDDEPELTTLYMRLNSLMLKANANAFGFDVDGFTSIQFTEYHANDEGHYDWHEDNSWTNDTPYDRKLSLVVQLSDPEEYTGGRLLLANDPLPDGYFRDQGDVIIFPSFNRHMVSPVKLGVRYSLVTWFIGSKFR